MTTERRRRYNTRMTTNEKIIGAICDIMDAIEVAFLVALPFLIAFVVYISL